MAKRKRRPKRNKNMPPYGPNSSDIYTRKIIKCLERVGSLSGYNPSIIFDDWLVLAEAALERLPECRFQRNCKKAKYSIVSVEKVNMEGQKSPA